MHFGRSFVQYAAGGGYNVCLLFADLEKAYDRVVREMAVGCRCTEADIASHLQCLWFDGDDLQWCLDFLRSGSSVMQEAGLEIELVDIVERKRVASRQIKRLLLKRNVEGAKVVPSVASSFRCSTRRPHARLPAVHAVKPCPSHSLLTTLGAPWPCSAHSMTSHVEIVDVEYVDNTMWAVRANTPAELKEKLIACSRWLRLVFSSTAFR